MVPFLCCTTFPDPKSPSTICHTSLNTIVSIHITLAPLLSYYTNEDLSLSLRIKPECLVLTIILL